MDEFKGREVPDILKPDELRICRTGEENDLDDDKVVNCDGVACCDCVFDIDNSARAEMYIAQYKPKDKIIETSKTLNRENNMNTNISNVFDKTKEALLVEKHLGHEIKEDFLTGLVLADKKDDVLKEAKRLEKEEKE